MFFEESGLFSRQETINPEFPLLSPGRNRDIETGHTIPENQRKFYKNIPQSTSTQYFIPNNIYWISNHQENFFDSRMCDNKVTNEEFQALLSEFRMIYVDNIKKARNSLIFQRYAVIFFLAYLLSLLLLAFLPHKWWALMGLSYVILMILFVLTSQKSFQVVSQLLQNMQKHFDHYNSAKYHSIGVHFITHVRYIQIVLDYQESDADLYQNHYLTSYGIVPAFQPGHYYFKTNLLSLVPIEDSKMEDTFDPSKVENLITAEEYQKFKAIVHMLIIKDESYKSYRFMRFVRLIIGLIFYAWYLLALVIWVWFPQIPVLLLFLIEVGFYILLYWMEDKDITIISTVVKRTQQVIDQESTNMPNSGNFRWKMITDEILKLQYKVEESNNEDQVP